MKVGEDPTHLLVADKAKEQLATDKVFYKKTVLADTPFEPYARHIHWDVIRHMAENDLGEQLVPVPEINGWDPSTHPEKFLPSSKRKTAGYARASALDPAVAKLHAERRIHWVAGAIGSANRLLLSYQNQGLALPVTTVPQLIAPTA
jgi:hypothetical protein